MRGRNFFVLGSTPMTTARNRLASPGFAPVIVRPRADLPSSGED
jgi:hypothetical protein